MIIKAHVLKSATRLLCIALALGVSAGCRRHPPVPDGILAEAAQEMLDGNTADARTLLEQEVASNPQSLTAQVNLGLACLQLDDLAAAVAAINRATEIAPDRPALWELLGNLLIRAGNAEGAAEVLDKVSKPTEVTFTLKALAAQHAGNRDGALLYIEQALKKNRLYPPALYNLAVLQRDGFDAPVEALAAFRRFREANPGNPRAAQSDDDFLKSVRSAPDPVAFPDILHEIATDESLAVTVTPQPPKPVPTAVTEPVAPPPQKPATPPVPPPSATTAVAPTPPAPAPKPAAPSPAQALIRKAESEISAGNNDAALLTLKNAVQQYPDSPDAVWALAVFYDKQLGLKDRADGLYATFLHMFPNDPRAKSRRTAATAPKPAAAPSATGESLFRKGLEHYSRQEWDAAVAAYRQALSLDPKSASCAYNLGLAYKAKDDLDAAVAAFRHALNLEPDMTKSLYMLGLTEIHRRRNADALPHLNRLIAIQPDFAKAHYLLGTAYQAENRPDTAAFHFERFLKLEPNDSTAPQVRRWLEQYRR